MVVCRPALSAVAFVVAVAVAVNDQVNDNDNAHVNAHAGRAVVPSKQPDQARGKK